MDRVLLPRTYFLQVIKATPAFGLNHLNRAIYTESDDSLDLQRDLFSWKVIQHLEKAFNEARNADFAVFDAILREKALQHFLGLLQRSTIWFDLTNGDYFASHFDDGLNFNSLVVFAQVNFPRYKVKDFIVLSIRSN